MTTAFAVSTNTTFGESNHDLKVLKSKDELYQWLDEFLSVPRYIHLNIMCQNIPENKEEAINLFEDAVSQAGKPATTN